MKRFVMGLLLVLGSGMATPAWAAESELPKNTWEIGPEIYYSWYKEPAVNVEWKGPMYGLAGSFAHHNPNHLMLRTEGHGALGLVDYSGSGTLNNIQWALEGRMAAGYDILLNDGQRLTPFFGVGYRYLNNDSSGKTTSTGAIGYDRESNYVYSPIGLEFGTKLNDGWRIGMNAEYDLFWNGTQKTHLGDAIPGLNTISNNQNQGYGIRGSVKLQKIGERFDVVIEPYVRWWNIKDSNLVGITHGGTIVGFGYEPKNETLEVGGGISVRF